MGTHYSQVTIEERCEMNRPAARLADAIYSGSPCGIRTRDLRLERAVSWAARRRGHMFSG